MTQKIADFLAEKSPPTPCLVVDLDVVAENYLALSAALPDARIFYAIKANPGMPVLRTLRRLGSNFDAASLPEVEMCLKAGARPDQISYGNTIKKLDDIKAAYEKGVRLFAFDSEAELRKIAAAAPGSRVFCRLLTSGNGAAWPLSRKFGCEIDMARDLLVLAQELGLEAWGASFHVGSQQTDSGEWDIAIARTAALFTDLESRGVRLRMLNVGGGFPARYESDVPDEAEIGQHIMDSLRTHFGNRLPECLMVEPGRSIVADAGVLQSEVVLVSRKSWKDDARWVYLDIGKFGGLAETMEEAIRYPIRTGRTGRPLPVILAGPTCDSADVLYERGMYSLPEDLEAGDRIEIHATGAYTASYASVGFNGFAPLRSYYI